jgi:hypothetical protein
VYQCGGKAGKYAQKCLTAKNAFTRIAHAKGKVEPMSSPVLAPSALESTEKSAIQKISIKQLYIFLWKLTIATIMLVLPFVVLAAVIDMVKSR